MEIMQIHPKMRKCKWNKEMIGAILVIDRVVVKWLMEWLMEWWRNGWWNDGEMVDGVMVTWLMEWWWHGVGGEMEQWRKNLMAWWWNDGDDGDGMDDDGGMDGRNDGKWW